VLHTRISEQLSNQIREFAEDLRVPASNLVRNVLEEVFTMVETVSEDVGDLFEDVLDEAESARDRMRERRQRNHRRRDGATRAESPAPPEPPHAAAPSTPPAAPEPPSSPKAFPDVIGWQPLVLNQDQACASCGVELSRGTRAFVGLGERGLMRTTLCSSCTGAR